VRYRALDASGDSTFGSGFTAFLVNSPAAVGQAVITRLGLMTREWFLDQTEGTPYSTEILIEGGRITADQAIRARILGTQGVIEIAEYNSEIIGRQINVQATLNTTYGQTTIATVI
jgi:hypothetical protein